MSGSGKRFRDAGHEILKPLIKVNGRRMIDHVRSMYPKNSDVIFICSETDLNNKDVDLVAILNEIDNRAQIVSIKAHKKGPGWAVKEAFSSINLEQPTFVNYCDFFNLWDFDLIDKYIKDNNPDGLIITYRDEHPHTVWCDSYAHIQNVRDRVTNIQEKKPFTENPKSEFKSTGTYFFKSGEVLVDYIAQQIREELTLKDEYYMSLTYIPMLKRGLDIRHFEIEHFFQWGTPEDLNDFNWWVDNHKNKIHQETDNGLSDFSLCLLCAGKGERFSRAGFLTSKPLISFAGESLLEASASVFDNASWKGAVLSPDISDNWVSEKLADFNLVKLDEYTKGQADSALHLVKLAPKEAPLVVASSDLKMSFNLKETLRARISKNKDWAIVFLLDPTYPFAVRKPCSYSWVGYVGDEVTDYSFKSMVPNCDAQAPLSGSFMFSSGSLAVKYIEKVLSVNDDLKEAYVDDVLPLLLEDEITIYQIIVDSMNCLGTPEEYLTNFYYHDSLPRFLRKKC